MKFSAFREFKDSLTDFTSLARYFQFDFANMIRELNVGLSKLSLTDNFDSFQASVTIKAGQELAIRNELRNKIPTQRIITRSNSASIVDGTTPWTVNYVYLKNTGAADATITVIFLQ